MHNLPNHPWQPGGPLMVFNDPTHTPGTMSQIPPSFGKSLSHTGSPKQREEIMAYLHELLCSFLRCLLRPIVVRGLMGWDPRGRVLGLVQGKA